MTSCGGKQEKLHKEGGTPREEGPKPRKRGIRLLKLIWSRKIFAFSSQALSRISRILKIFLAIKDIEAIKAIKAIEAIEAIARGYQQAIEAKYFARDFAVNRQVFLGDPLL